MARGLGAEVVLRCTSGTAGGLLGWQNFSPPACSPRGAQAFVQVLPHGAHHVLLEQILLRPFFQLIFPSLTRETSQTHHGFHQCICPSLFTESDKLVLNDKNPSLLFFPLQPFLLSSTSKTAPAESSSILRIISQNLKKIQAEIMYDLLMWAVERGFSLAAREQQGSLRIHCEGEVF